MRTLKTFHQIFAVSCILLSVSAFAQKLPDSQEKGIRAPAGVKIDGKSTEWTSMQAFNKNTEVAYTIANDDSTLYLVVQSEMASITSKIMRGGITFTVNTDGKKKEKDGVSITFPVIAPPEIRVNGAGVTGGGASGGGGVRQTFTVTSGSPSAPGMQGDAAAMKKYRDSVTYANNIKQIEKFKDVKVKGIASITDSLLSIYNEEGIKARCTYEEKGLYSYELAIPFKYLAVDVNNPKELVFNLKLNGLNLGGMMGGIVINGGMGNASNDFQSMMSVTDFWGKYIPVK